MTELWQDYLEPFLDSNFLQTLATVFTVGFAVWKYRKYKVDEKKSAAAAIVSEIKHSDKEIKRIKQSKSVDQSNVVLKNNSWVKYGHLFTTKDLSQDSRELINEYYENCALVQKIVEENQRNLWKTIDEKRRVFFDILSQELNPSNNKSDVHRSNFRDSDVIYAPNLVNWLLDVVNGIGLVRGTVAYEELLKIAKR